MSFNQLAGFTAILLLTGCGGPPSPFERVAIQGTVTIDNLPLCDASIRFVPNAKTVGPKITLPIRDGFFQAGTDQGPVPGLHRVEIVLTDDVAHAHDDEQGWEQMKAERIGRKPHTMLPAIYNESSTLTAMIEPQENSDHQSLKYELKSR